VSGGRSPRGRACCGASRLSSLAATLPPLGAWRVLVLDPEDDLGEVEEDDEDDEEDEGPADVPAGG
jgi:hypothetical protein